MHRRMILLDANIDSILELELLTSPSSDETLFMLTLTSEVVAHGCDVVNDIGWCMIYVRFTLSFLVIIGETTSVWES